MIAFDFPENLKHNVIITFDTKNRSDDSCALAYALLSPRLNVKGIIATHFDLENSVAISHKQADKILSLTKKQVPVIDGSLSIFDEDDASEPLSEGAQFIIDQASSQRITVLCMTALTDIAMAIRKAPSIIPNLKIIWAGGGAYPKGAQYEPNIMIDRDGANYVLQSGCDFYQIPKNIYRMFSVSFSELYIKVKPHGELGEYLYNLILNRANDPQRPLRTGCYWVLGDLSIIGAALSDNSFLIDEKPAPVFSRHCVYTDIGTHYTINVFNNIDTRFIMEDFFAKLQLFSM